MKRKLAVRGLTLVGGFYDRDAKFTTQARCLDNLQTSLNNARMFRHIIEPGLELRLNDHLSADEMFTTVDANREHLRRFMPWVDKTKSVDDTKNFIRKMLTQMADNNGFAAGIWERDRYVGNIGFHWIRWERRFTEIGYWLSADAQGRGIMTKACTAMIEHAFNAWKLNKVEIRCDPENARSRAIPQRLGFKQEGILRQVLTGGDEQLHDSVVYGMLAHEWVARIKAVKRG